MNEGPHHRPRPLPELTEEVKSGLRSVYGDLDGAVARLAPICELSGRCCRFGEYGHTLFLSAIEAALLILDHPHPPRPLDRGHSCPWQDQGGRCTARESRPLGCRVYFCDPGFQEQDRAATLTEDFLGQIKEIVRDNDLPWDYAPLHHHLEAAREGGRLAIEVDPPLKSQAVDPED